MRQVVLDTETTGLEVEQDHRIIEIGCVEIFNRRLTGRHFHRYLNPERDIDEGALEVHGLTREQLAQEPKFADIRAELLEFVRDAELIIHNAAFDVAFLDAELARLGEGTGGVAQICRILDTLSLARQMHPGQRNSLDALCRRYSVDNSHRDYHGALLDARLLAEVYLAMTGGQATLVLSAESDTAGGRARPDAPRRSLEGVSVVVIAASEEEMAAHEQVLALLDKASAGKTVWRAL
ncbi:MAG TPA: DNA polymerase III subunit epsilon [Steroidobacteraceae bacterium]|nr:DNA polymerase III subunit epsilon [Steroidobacteraceae bacterium]